MTKKNTEHVMQGSVFSLESLIISERVTTMKWGEFVQWGYAGPKNHLEAA